MRRVADLWGDLIGAIAILALTSGAFTVAAQALPGASPAGALTQVSGKILSIDLERQLLRLEVEKPAGSVPLTERMEFALTDRTVVIEEGQKVQPTDLQTGEAVRVEYAIENGKPVAHSIRIEEAAGTPLPERSTPEANPIP